MFLYLIILSKTVNRIDVMIIANEQLDIDNSLLKIIMNVSETYYVG